MADLQTCHGATDLFSIEALGAFHTQSSNSNHAVERVDVRSKNGGVGCTFNNINGRTEYSAVYEYCGNTLAADLDALLATFGSVRNSKLVDRVTINFTPNRPPQLTVNGHNHDTNSHDTGSTAPTRFNGSGVLTGATGGIGAWDAFGLGAVDTCTASSSVTFTLEHTDFVCSGGNHGVGVSTAATAEASVEYIGSVSASGLDSAWTYVSSDESDSNSDVCKQTITAYRQLSPVA